MAYGSIDYWYEDGSTHIMKGVIEMDDIFSKRYKEIPDIFEYDSLSEKFKNQIIHIWSKSIHSWSTMYIRHISDIEGSRYNDRRNSNIEIFDVTKSPWYALHNLLAEAYGVPVLKELDTYKYNNQYYSIWVSYFLDNTIPVERCLDMIEVSSRLCYYNYVQGESYVIYSNIHEDINKRFLENGIGYQLEKGKIIRVDNNFIHSNTTKKALNLIADSLFNTVNSEYLEAHEHYKNSRFDDALVHAEKAFESCMKIICHNLGYTYNQNSNASKLIGILKQESFIEGYIQDHLNGLAKTLQSGLPTIRNKLGGHGAGVLSITVERETAEYALNLAATNIVYLISVYKKKK